MVLDELAEPDVHPLLVALGDEDQVDRQLPVHRLDGAEARSTATICGPFELVAPRPMSTFLNGACSTSRPSNGGAIHTSGCVTGIVSYIQ